MIRVTVLYNGTNHTKTRPTEAECYTEFNPT